MPLSVYNRSPFHLPHHLNPKYYLNEHAALYLTHTLRSISISLAGIFLPIYIFGISKDYMIFNPNVVVNALTWVMLFFFLKAISTVVLTLFLSESIFTKLKFQWSIIISFAAILIEIVFWIAAENNLYLILVASLFAGLKVVTYWIPFHLFFIRKFEKKGSHYGKDTSLRFFLVRLVTSIAPFVGGLIISLSGFKVLFIVSILTLVIASIPLFMSVHEWEHDHHDAFSTIKKYMFNKKFSKITTAFIADGADMSIYSAAYPILMFVILSDFVKIGTINSISLVISSLIILVAGRAIDKYGSKRMHRFGTLFNGAIHFPRMFINSAGFLYALDILGKMNPFFGLPMTTTSYEQAKKNGTSDFMIYRELAIHSGIVLTMGALIILINITGAWRWVFGIATIASFLTYNIQAEVKK